MDRRAFLAALPTSLLLSAAHPCLGADPQKTPLQLFGTTLKRAKRSDLRAVFKKNGLRAIREDDRYWVDIYQVPDGILEGANAFEAGYLLITGTFAYARYTFPGRMDTQLVGKVVRMVQGKYGEPLFKQGRESLGPVKVEWSAWDEMWVQVTRDWPDTTTYLRYEDNMANALMKKEMAEHQARREQERSKQQSDAF